MSGGLLALLDDVVALTKIAAVTLDDAAGQAAQASAKAAGIVIDDAAVTPRYVVGLAAERDPDRCPHRLGFAQEQNHLPAASRYGAVDLCTLAADAHPDDRRALSVL